MTEGVPLFQHFHDEDGLVVAGRGAAGVGGDGAEDFFEKFRGGSSARSRRQS